MQELNFRALESFCTAWLRKAERIDTEPLEGVFDRFFTLWVVFNRLYEEAGRTLAHRGHPIYRSFIKRRGPRVFAPPPDKISATKGITVFVGHHRLRAHIQGDAEAMRGLEYIHDAIRNGMLYLHENHETGEPDTEKDLVLVDKAIGGCVKSTLTLIYQARCNLFHGQKAFTEAQRELLIGMSSILIQVIECSFYAVAERVERA
ncbi:hypothetical protein BZG72_07295 [Salinivibrio sp. PR6]|uniref:hypothetical protein n=1 Tax=Salinivibrio sp. PR6 TaxID=1909485 RepID=UPI000988F399|nr:hypothetical protein [Salinivibrio sp. PR6]OOE82801.1 hypothetical protein BZG72_07295 [Salinivibrio sp. PR6]